MRKSNNSMFLSQMSVNIRFLKKYSQHSLRAKKCKNINTQAQFESPKHVEITNYETQKYYSQNNVLKLLIQEKM
jgi:hypothetical protein